eukprot:366426-Chlamydomonas_euryale.AAC.13
MRCGILFTISSAASIISCLGISDRKDCQHGCAGSRQYKRVACCTAFLLTKLLWFNELRGTYALQLAILAHLQEDRTRSGQGTIRRDAGGRMDVTQAIASSDKTCMLAQLTVWPPNVISGIFDVHEGPVSKIRSPWPYDPAGTRTVALSQYKAQAPALAMHNDFLAA